MLKISFSQIPNGTKIQYYKLYLTIIIIPRVRMGSESITHEAEGRMGYWLRGREGERNNNCFSKIQLVGKKLSRQNSFS